MHRLGAEQALSLVLTSPVSSGSSRGTGQPQALLAGRAPQFDSGEENKILKLYCFLHLKI